MIAPDYRVTDPQQKFAENAAKYIKYTYGDTMWNDLETDIQGVETLHN